jgi:hypothetical protein
MQQGVYHQAFGLEHSLFLIQSLKGADLQRTRQSNYVWQVLQKSGLMRMFSVHTSRSYGATFQQPVGMKSEAGEVAYIGTH